MLQKDLLQNGLLPEAPLVGSAQRAITLDARKLRDNFLLEFKPRRALASNPLTDLLLLLLARRKERQRRCRLVPGIQLISWKAPLDQARVITKFLKESDYDLNVLYSAGR